ncbi:MAG: oligopeptide ABC transporter permease OppB [Alphaproteobacteria bacterium]|nr:oligopeptide ABC transporter permease OppB [Alphaproteobacteria bacterium]MDA7988694.1 oligopeptide ABC transporter permease OppB [Alphaproteobacteria bacterium]MDA8030576.1 oligopeptide ABC transporter permease OppB [Alphaproteobacteria bacterium]
MLRFAFSRLLVAIPTLFLVITAAFFLMRAAPGGPFDTERPLPPEIERNIRAAYDLDKPLLHQYTIYLSKVLRGDLGPSIKIQDFTVNDLIAQGAPASIQIGLSAIILAFVLGTLLGTLAALRHNSSADFSVMTLAMIGIVIPNFVMAPLLSLFFGVYLDWLPTSGWGDGGELQYRILPITALALPQIAYIARLTRGSMIETLNANYIRTARAKGLPERAVIIRHALKGALLPVVSYLGPAMAFVLTGSVVIETIFSIPGIGRYFINAALNRDYPLVMGVVIVFALFIITLNFLVDIAYGYLDPKLRAQHTKR